MKTVKQTEEKIRSLMTDLEVAIKDNQRKLAKQITQQIQYEKGVLLILKTFTPESIKRQYDEVVLKLEEIEKSFPIWHSNNYKATEDEILIRTRRKKYSTITNKPDLLYKKKHLEYILKDDSIKAKS